jgi:ABC-type nitrate/sulfonate/bicarbonate transport system substrate-binding protein
MNLSDKVKVVYTATGSMQTDMQLFLTRQADVVAGLCFNDLYRKQSPNPDDVGTFFFDDYGSKLINIVLVAHDKMILRDPELVKRFVRASNKSLKYAMGHPDEATKAFIVRYPDLKYEDEREYFGKALPYIPSYDNKVGSMSWRDWDKLKKALLETGGLEADVNVDKCYTNKFQ